MLLLNGQEFRDEVRQLIDVGTLIHRHDLAIFQRVSIAQPPSGGMFRVEPEGALRTGRDRV